MNTVTNEAGIIVQTKRQATFIKVIDLSKLLFYFDPLDKEKKLNADNVVQIGNTPGEKTISMFVPVEMGTCLIHYPHLYQSRYKVCMFLSPSHGPLAYELNTYNGTKGCSKKTAFSLMFETLKQP